MDYVNLGKTGLKVSRLCLGMMSYGTPEWRDWVLSEEASRPFILRALEAGITFFDTANMYSLGVSEEVTGRALKDFARRDEVVIASKVYFPMGDKPNQGGLSRKHILDACDASLKRLGSDYIDLYQIHRWDYHTPIEETLGALHDLVSSGRVRYIGASSMFAWQFMGALYKADSGLTRFVSMQNHYNLIYREEEREMIPLCRAEGVAVLPWSPLARGYLTRPPGAKESTARGKVDDYAKKLYTREGDDEVVGRVAELAERRGVSQAQVALAWLLHKPVVTAPIIGATKMQHLDDAIAALALELTAEEIAQLEAPYRPHPVLGHGYK
ncbi:aldo/keto reductase [soil metagenome]|jgi:aryl-alcohol dehydrogenase (NADP+)|nr:aldo/keto reductase [Deinococcota bacterium]